MRADHEKAYCADLRPGQDGFDLRGIDRQDGCAVVVRPDQHVAIVVPLQEIASLARFFAGFLLVRQ